MFVKSKNIQIHRNYSFFLYKKWLNFSNKCSLLVLVVVGNSNGNITDDEEAYTDNSDDHEEGNDTQEYVDVQIVFHIYWRRLHKSEWKGHFHFCRYLSFVNILIV